MAFILLISDDAVRDIDEAIEWYESHQNDLGLKFYSILIEHIDQLRSNPFFQIRYSNVRCLPLSVFPYMIHFTVDSEAQTVIIRAVFNTSLDPKKWRIRK